MAQEVEHVLGKDGVTGSNPVSSSKKALLSTGSAFFVAGVRNAAARQKGLPFGSPFEFCH